MGQRGRPLSIYDKFSVCSKHKNRSNVWWDLSEAWLRSGSLAQGSEEMQEWQIIAAGDWSCSLYAVLKLGNLSIHVSSGQHELFPHLAKSSLIGNVLMLHLCIAHKPHKLKVVTHVGFVRKPTALSNEREVDKHVSSLLRLLSSQRRGCIC